MEPQSKIQPSLCDVENLATTMERPMKRVCKHTSSQSCTHLSLSRLTKSRGFIIALLRLFRASWYISRPARVAESILCISVYECWRVSARSCRAKTCVHFPHSCYLLKLNSCFQKRTRALLLSTILWQSGQLCTASWPTNDCIINVDISRCLKGSLHVI